MSLINEALRELERRGSGIAGQNAGRVRAVPAPKPARHAPGWLRWAIWPTVLVLSAGVLWWSQPLELGAADTAAPSTLATPAEPARADADPPTTAAASTRTEPAAIDPRPADTASATPPIQEATAVSVAPLQAAPGAPVTTQPAKPAKAVAQSETPAVPLAAAPISAQPPTPATPPATPPATGPAPEVLRRSTALTPVQQAEQAYERGITALRGAGEDAARLRTAKDQLRQALALHPEHAAARQALAAALMRAGAATEALELLREGLARDPAQSAWTQLAARIALELGDAQHAMSILRSGLPHAAQPGTLQGFLAAILAQQGRHDEAMKHYEAALRSDPAHAPWWMGLGLSLQALDDREHALRALTESLRHEGLSPRLQAYVRGRIEELKQ